jgi:hypothetical protein
MKKTKMMKNRSDLKKLRNIHDVRLLKERLRYDIKLNEKEVTGEFNILRQTFIGSIKDSLRQMGQEILTLALIKIFERRRNR